MCLSMSKLSPEAGRPGRWREGNGHSLRLFAQTVKAMSIHFFLDYSRPGFSKTLTNWFICRFNGMKLGGAGLCYFLEIYLRAHFWMRKLILKEVP